jgi:hypothetical protein
MTSKELPAAIKLRPILTACCESSEGISEKIFTVFASFSLKCGPKLLT